MTALRIIVPLILGVIAGAVNFYVLQGMVAPLELTAIKADIRPGSEITSEDMLVKVQVRSDSATIFKSALPWADRGTAVKRRVNRPLVAGEVLLFADVRSEGADDIKALLKPGEVSFTFAAVSSRVAPGLKSGESVALVVASDETAAGGRRVLGPFRLLSLGEAASAARSADGSRQVTVAVPVTKQGELPANALSLDAATSTDTNRRGGVLAVEFYKAG